MSSLVIIGQADMRPIQSIVKVTHQGAALSAKCDVYDCVVSSALIGPLTVGNAFM